jgi:hypothetical protein
VCGEAGEFGEGVVLVLEEEVVVDDDDDDEGEDVIIWTDHQYEPHTVGCPAHDFWLAPTERELREGLVRYA